MVPWKMYIWSYSPSCLSKPVFLSSAKQQSSSFCCCFFVHTVKWGSMLSIWTSLSFIVRIITVEISLKSHPGLEWHDDFWVNYPLIKDVGHWTVLIFTVILQISLVAQRITKLTVWAVLCALQHYCIDNWLFYHEISRMWLRLKMASDFRNDLEINFQKR